MADAGVARAKSPFLQRLERWVPLGPEERSAITALEAAPITARAGTTLVIEGEAASSMLILAGGWAVGYRLLPDGRRQILSIVLPGDIAAPATCFLDTADCHVATLTRVRAARPPRSTFLEVMAEHPRLAFGVACAGAEYGSLVAEHLVDIGRRSAYERVGHFLLELWHRLRLVGLAGNAYFLAPLSHAVIADSLGLSLVHVSRTLRRLEDDKLILVRHGSFRHFAITDVEALQRSVAFDAGYLRLTQRPLPL